MTFHQFTMTSIRVKYFASFAIVALSLNSGILCGPAFGFIRRWDTNVLNNRTAGSVIGIIRQFNLNEDVFGTERIVGGQFAMPHQFPFMAVVHRLIGDGMVSQCGGTIISARWVLTAGHCVAPEPQRFLVVFGINDKTGIGFDFYNGRGISMLTEQGIVHPDYSVTLNDIALLYMPRDIPFGETIQPIQLAGYSGFGDTFADKTSMVIGWGKDGPAGTGTTRLKYATLPIVSNSNCRSYWDVSSKHVCTANGYGQDACQGDSGGPLIVMKNDQPLQVGIVSYGDGDCPSDKPGVFSRVSSFIDWIENVTGLQLSNRDVV